LWWFFNTFNQSLCLYRNQDFLFMKTKISLLVLLLAIGLGSCNIGDLSDAKFASISPEWALPLIDDTIRVEDIAVKSNDDGSIKTFSNNLYYFIYSDEILGPSLEEAVVIPDTSTVGSAPLLLPGGASGSTVNLPQQRLNFSFNNLVLQDLLFKGGSLGAQVRLLNSLGSDISATISLRFDSIRNGSQPLTITSANGARGTGSLTGFRYTNKSVSNTSAFYYTPVITLNQATTAGTYTLQSTVNFNQAKFSFADVIATNLIPLQPIFKEIRIKLFDNRYDLDKNDIRFDDPSLQFIVKNGFGGSPLNLSITNLRSFSEAGGTAQQLTGAGVTNWQSRVMPIANVNYANAQVVKSGILADTLDKRNTNINDIIKFYNPAPKYVSFIARATTQNFTSRISGADTSRFRVRTNAILPSDGVVNSYTLADTFDLNDIPENNADQTIESASFKLVFYNQFPVDIIGNVYFVDANYKVLDSVSVPDASGKVDFKLGSAAKPGGAPEFRVPAAAATRNERIFLITKARYDKIQKNCKKGIFRARLNSYKDNVSGTPERARIYSDYAIRLKLGVSAKVTLNIN